MILKINLNISREKNWIKIGSNTRLAFNLISFLSYVPLPKIVHICIDVVTDNLVSVN
jgi:hypothetical protein